MSITIDVEEIQQLNRFTNTPYDHSVKPVPKQESVPDPDKVARNKRKDNILANQTILEENINIFLFLTHFCFLPVGIPICIYTSDDAGGSDFYEVLNYIIFVSMIIYLVTGLFYFFTKDNDLHQLTGLLNTVGLFIILVGYINKIDTAQIILYIIHTLWGFILLCIWHALPYIDA